MLKLHTLKPAGRLSSLLLAGAFAFVLAVAGAFVGVFGQASVAHAEPSDDPALEQTVESDERTVTGERAVMDVGHADLGMRRVDGEWVLQVRDDRTSPAVWRNLEDVVIQVHDAGKQQIPDSGYEFTGAKGGEEAWVVPQVEVSGVVWLGWNTQDPELIKHAERGVTMKFSKAEGPGQLTLFLQPGNFGDPQVLVDSSNLAEHNSVFIEKNTHTHANWVFTKEGQYTTELTMTAEDSEGKKVSASGSLVFAVGDATDTDAAHEAAKKANSGAGKGSAGDAAGKDSAGDKAGDDAAVTPGGDNKAGDEAGDDDAASTEAGENKPAGASLAWWLAGGAAVVIAVGVIVGVVLQRKRRATEKEVWGSGAEE
ncbi:choice-of-anchor M domain-containing protein [Pseudoglutamicibacter albus]|uniref:choice-of-anchor M domain-containing protein n=1 Tax=Pseudoglutamicibacter albus TaxID=98671 RepID=UPI000C77266C|nr:choice-of-anchor M domain-containing protein [Pseudoglutamicibacter albus]PKY80713.1 hypothetical protein CYJ35_02915 [Pseudoglutamicibacter albus]WIK85044.1 choice-of-anchor M domain-containing protein [Pseudoglutamicibacter albus]